jgi:hypothetical protein
MVPFTLFEYHQRIIELFMVMLSDPAKKTILEALGGKPFDIQNLSLNDLKYTVTMDPWGTKVEDVIWDVGDWTFKFYMAEASQWIRKTQPEACEFNISVTHRGDWAYRNDFRFDRSVPLALDHEDVMFFIQRIIDAPKRRIGITIREAEKYLANQAYYDTLKAVLNIKPRKKK